MQEDDVGLGIGSYRDLRVWRKGMDLVVMTYTLTKRLPDDERYGLTAQARRAAVSVPSNIAEGYGRWRLGDYLRFLGIANGSLKQLETHVLIAERLEFLTPDSAHPLLALSSDLGRMLLGLMRKLERTARRN